MRNVFTQDAVESQTITVLICLHVGNLKVQSYKLKKHWQMIVSEVNSGTTIFCERNQCEHVVWLLQNLGCIGSSLIEKQRHDLERLDVYWDNRWFNCESRLILAYFKYILYNYTKYTQPPGYSLSVDRTISDNSLRDSKVSWKFHIPTINNLAERYPWDLLFS